MAKMWTDKVRLHFNTSDLSLNSTQFSLIASVLPLDPTVFGDTGERVIAGLRNDALEWAGLYADEAGAFHAEGANIGSGTYVLSVLMGTLAGSIAYVSQKANYFAGKHLADVRGLVRMEAVFGLDGTWQKGIHYGAKIQLGGGGTVSGTHDNGVLTTAGTAFLQVFATTLGPFSATLDHSVDGTIWVALINFGLFTAATSVVVAVASTINRYTRARSPGAGVGTATWILVRT